MSSYRPKSLDELNDRYGQALSAGQAIKRGVSGFKAAQSGSAQEQPSRTADAGDAGTDVQDTIPVDDISAAVNDFIKQYAAAAAADRPKRYTGKRQSRSPRRHPRRDALSRKRCSFRSSSGRREPCKSSPPRGSAAQERADARFHKARRASEDSRNFRRAGNEGGRSD